MHDKSSIIPMRFMLHLALMACAALLLLTRPTMVTLVRDQNWSPWWLFLGPAIFFFLFIALIGERLIAKGIKLHIFTDLLPTFFGLAVIATLLSSALIEFRARRAEDTIGINFIKSFSHHQDARVRALAILALANYNFNDLQAIALIDSGLLDKDPLVQRAANWLLKAIWE